MNPKDLGTYHVKVELINGDGFIMEYKTGMRFSHGSGGVHPLNATPIPPTWESEDHLISTTVFMFTEGNYACECNLKAFLDRAHQRDEQDYECGCGGVNPLGPLQMTLIRPDASELVIYSILP